MKATFIMSRAPATKCSAIRLGSSLPAKPASRPMARNRAAISSMYHFLTRMPKTSRTMPAPRISSTDFCGRPQARRRRRRAFAAAAAVQFAHRAQLRVLAHLFGVDHHIGHDDRRAQEPQHQAVAQARVQGQVGEALGDAHGEGVEAGGGEAGGGPEEGDGDADDRIVAERHGQRDEDQHEGDALLRHAVGAARQREHDHQRRDDQPLQFPARGEESRQPLDAGLRWPRSSA